MPSLYENLTHADAGEIRGMIREGAYRGHTAGLGHGLLQTNLVIMDEAYALDFARYCQRNPKPCPLVGVTDTGSPYLETLGHDLDVRYDLPAYNIYRDGRLDTSVNSIEDLWHDRLVAFAIGCSFTFEHALQRAGIPVWHIDHDTTVPMYRSSLETRPAGPFRGKMVVSMRPIPEARVETARTVSMTYAHAHGAPVHVGDPAAIGITALDTPDWGDPAPVADGTVPVFWACGVTPQVAVEAARLPLVITHKPGHMLITDVAEDAEFPLVSTTTN